MTNSTFTIGQTYYTRSICDSDCVIKVTIESRTKCFVKTTDGKRLKVSVYNGVEQVSPWGKYSMSPKVDSTKVFNG